MAYSYASRLISPLVAEHRRRPGQGSIEARGPGRWRLRLAGERRTISAATEAEALTVLARWAEERGYARPPARTLIEVLDAYVEHTARKRSANSQEEVRRIIDKYLRPTCGAWALEDITAPRLEALYGRLRYYQKTGGKKIPGAVWLPDREVWECPLSDQTIRHVHYVIRPALRFAKRQGWVDRNVAEDVELDELRRQEIQLPPVDVVIGLLEHVHEQPTLELYLRLLSTSGARRAEIAALTRGDINWMSSTITINRSLAEVKVDGRRRRELAIIPPKTAKSRRTVVLDFDTLGLLERHLARLVDDGCDDGPHRWVFPNLREDAIGAVPERPSTWSGRFIRLKKATGVDMRLHDFRHLHASVLLDSGMKVGDVSARLGHARTSTTQDVYGHLLTSGADKEAAEIIGRTLRSGGLTPAD